jgi:hypothetical protein
MAASVRSSFDAADSGADKHICSILAVHFDPAGGSPYWLDRQNTLGIDVRQEIRSVNELHRLGVMDENALRDRPVLDFVPLSRRDQLAGAIVTETGGTTGRPKRTLFSASDFRSAFVQPFVAAARYAGFPEGGFWLWVGPSGPHVIGQAAAACATAMGCAQPFSVDFDPRWYRKLPADSLARNRYLEHLVDQARSVLEREPIEVLFTTPVVLERLAQVMTAEQRERIRGVHYGGMRVKPDLLLRAQTEWYPAAVHLSGYGNSLFGVCMDLGGGPDRPLRYFPYGARLQVRVADDGRVWMSRLDETVLIVNLPERDAAAVAPLPADAPAGFGAGIEDPHPITDAALSDAQGIY